MEMETQEKCAEGRQPKAEGQHLQPPASSLQPRRGQVMLEMAISVIGLVMFTYVALKTWVWLSTMIPERQAAFQRTRVQAGKMTIEGRPRTAGLPVPYQPPRLQLVGAAGSTRGVPGGVPRPPMEDMCVPGNPLVREAERLEGIVYALITDYNGMMGQVNILNQQLQALGDQLQPLRDQEAQLRNQIADLDTRIAALNARINDPNTPPEDIPALIAQRDALIAQRDDLDAQRQANVAQQAVLQAQIDVLLPQRDQLLNQANRTLERADALYDQARDLLIRGTIGCP